VTAMLRSGLLLLAPLVWVLGCAVPVAADLDEPQANQVVLALSHGGIAAEKQTDSRSDDRWQVEVARGDAPGALAVLAEQGLPSPPAPGVLDALGPSSLVPSRTREHARVVAGTAAEIEQTLRRVDGVVTAHVHLAVPLADAWATPSDATSPTAAVLLRYRGSSSPLDEPQIRRLVAGAVTDLDPERVAVVSSPVVETAPAAAPQLVRVGPLAVARSSLSTLQLLLGIAFGLNVLLTGLVLALWARLRRGQPGPEPPRAMAPASQDAR